MSDTTEVWRNVWYCEPCEQAFNRSGSDPDEMVCFKGHRMEIAAVMYHRTRPANDPLEKLLVASDDE